MKILAIDLGLKLGYAYRNSQGELVSSVCHLNENKKASNEIRWQVLWRFLTNLHFVENFEGVAYEQPGRLFGYAKKILPGIQAIIELWAAQSGVSIQVCSPSALKKFATGDGRADKDMMGLSAGLRWPGAVFETHDEVDARFVLTFFEKKHVRKVGDKEFPEAQQSGNHAG